jgi:hypothetical protein
MLAGLPVDVHEVLIALERELAYAEGSIPVVVRAGTRSAVGLSSGYHVHHSPVSGLNICG